MYGNVKE